MAQLKIQLKNKAGTDLLYPNVKLSNIIDLSDSSTGYHIPTTQEWSAVTSGGLVREIVEQLPTEDISPNTIYMVPKQTQSGDQYYDEYIYTNNRWEKIGDTQVSLDGYATEQYVDSAISDALELLDDYAPLANPAFTGTPTAPTPSTDTGIANKKYVDDAISDAFSELDLSYQTLS